MKNKNKKLEEQIMSQIKNGKIKLRSKYVFLAEKLGLNSAVALTLVLGILFFSLLFFYMKTAGILDYLTFGKDGIWAFLESFPYLLLITLVFILFFAGYFLNKTGWSYKFPFKYLVFLILGAVFLGGSVLAYTDVPIRIENQVLQEKKMGNIFRPLIKRPLHLGQKGIIGEIINKEKEWMTIETVEGKIKVNLPPNCCENLKKGDFAVGIRTGKDKFEIKKIKKVNKNHNIKIIENRLKNCKMMNKKCPNCPLQ